MTTLPCACGTGVTADSADPGPGVRQHVRGEAHSRWSARTRLHPMRLPRPTVALTADRLRELGLAPERAA